MLFQLDHRRIADEMEIFFFDSQIGAGLPIWLPNGEALREALEHFIKKLEKLSGYQRVVSPHIARAELYQLPVRIAEYGQVYRYENSGSLRGLSRVRGLCQNDAHIYIDPESAQQEIHNVLVLHEKCYSTLGLKGYKYRLSKHDPQQMQNFDGDISLWQQCEEILRQSLLQMQLPFYEAVGEAAFYGPKIDIQMLMGGNEESIASVQLDFNSSEKFELEYINSKGEKQRPWIIHRAPLGSHERFIALLLEYFQGQLPAWLCPIQLYILPLNEESLLWSQMMAQNLLRQNIRVVIDVYGGHLSKRKKKAHHLRPFAQLVVGSKELSSEFVNLQIQDNSISVLKVELESFLVEKIKEPTF